MDSYLLADLLLALAVKVVVQAVCVIAGLIALTVVEDAPALWVSTAGPRVHGQ